MSRSWKKTVLVAVIYIIIGLMATKVAMLYRETPGNLAAIRLIRTAARLSEAFRDPMPSFYPSDLLFGAMCSGGLWLLVKVKGKNAKKYRKNVEYGSARWGTRKDIEPFIDPNPRENVILTKTESLTMKGRVKKPKYGRNKNVMVIGGSGSGKTRFFIKPNLLQMHSSYVITDPKGTVAPECGNALLRGGYKIRILNTINFKKSHHYNPFAYIHSEKDILKFVTTLMANTDGEGKASDPFWPKAEKLLYCALVAYIHYEAPEEERCFSTLLEFINSFEVREDDENFKNAVDMLFEELAEKNPRHFAVRQYKKFKLAAGVIS